MTLFLERRSTWNSWAESIWQELSYSMCFLQTLHKPMLTHRIVVVEKVALETQVIITSKLEYGEMRGKATQYQDPIEKDRHHER